MEVTPELAELFGAFAGDGTMSKYRTREWLLKASISASREEAKWVNYLSAIVQKSFNYCPKIRSYPNELRLQIWANKICNYLNTVGFPIGKKASTLRVPEIVKNARDEGICKAFLRGYFDADGCITFQRHLRGGYKFKRIYHYYPRILLGSVSKDFINNDISGMLSSIGFRYCNYENSSCRERYHIVYGIVISGLTQLDYWMREIGSSNLVHLTKYQVWKRFGFCPPHTTLNQRLAILLGKLNPRVFYRQS